jgi:heme exporter protein A
MTETRPIIEAQGLMKAYGLMPVLRGLDLTIQRGEAVALLGPNGSGKSTFLRLVTGLTRPTGGLLRVGGWMMPEEAAAVRSHLGLVSHKSLLYENLTARENLRFFGRLYNLPKAALEQRIDDLLRRVGLFKRGHDQPRTFSRGMLQRLSIARALIPDPDILLFDEPYTGLDQDAAATLDTLLTDARSEGRTILMTTHQLDKAVDMAARVVILSKGVIGYDAQTAGLDQTQLTQDYTRVTKLVSAR